MPKYGRVVIKFSGEALKGSHESGFEQGQITLFARELAEAKNLGVGIALVVGGGNIIRGAQFSQSGMDRTTADYMGMLATVINALVLQDAIERHGITTRVLSSVSVASVCEPYIRRRAVRHLEKDRIVILAGGTGNPFFSTDSAAALRGSEIDADILLKATNVDGVYSCDPKKDKNAELFRTLSFDETIRRDLKVMDATAFQLCRENNLPIRVFNLNRPGNIVAAVRGDELGTLISNT